MDDLSCRFCFLIRLKNGSLSLQNIGIKCKRVVGWLKLNLHHRRTADNIRDTVLRLAVSSNK